ncbi:MAG: insulinase family protein [Proteobacteria bacterium]|nr:insulinase family protein [Pseudomonadota bacterium]
MSESFYLPEALDVHMHTLLGGMRVVLCERSSLHRTSIMLNIQAGSRDEMLSGTAHMLEHLIFRGTQHYPSLRLLSEAFEALGADFNAYTAREVTSYDVSLPPGSLEGVLALLGEAILRPKLTGIGAEREIIREEILSDYDSDGALINVDDLLAETFYGEAGKPIAGKPEDIQKLTKAEILRYYEENYCAERMVLVIAGALGNRARLLDVITSAFAGLPSGSTPRRLQTMHPVYAHALLSLRTASPSLPPARICLRHHDGVAQSELVLGFLSLPASAGEFGILEMLVRVLDDGLASRLSRRLIEELALVYDAEAFLSLTRESSLLQIRLSCRHRRIVRLLDAVYEILGDLARDGVDPGELTRIRRRLIWEHEALLDNTPALAQWLSSMVLQNMPADLRTRCAELIHVSADDIRTMAGLLLTQRPHVVAIVGDLGPKTSQGIVRLLEDKLGQMVEFTKL